MIKWEMWTNFSQNIWRKENITVT